MAQSAMDPRVQKGPSFRRMTLTRMGGDVDVGFLATVLGMDRQDLDVHAHLFPAAPANGMVGLQGHVFGRTADATCTLFFRLSFSL